MADQHDARVPGAEAASAAGQGPSLDELRRARGEGWEWAKAATQACPQCGFDSGALPPQELIKNLTQLAGQWRQFLTNADPTYLRTNPGPGIFSPLQYGAHVRDIQHEYGNRILLALEHDNPRVPQFNPDEATWNSFNELAPDELSDGITEQAGRLVSLYSGLDAAARERTVVRDGGHDGIYQFTLTQLVSYAVHESHHHLLDANGTLAGAS